MFKELKIMKTLRYLLIVMGLMSILSISAQALAQQPQAQMQSTSIMAGSGSQLPSAAVQGTYVTGATIGTYSPANASGPHRAKKEDNDWEDDEWGDTGDPWATPIGDVMWPLMLLACAYCAFLIIRTRKREAR
jgi:hypothetical protein